MKRFLSGILSFLMVLSIVLVAPTEKPSAADAIADSSVFIKQLVGGSGGSCTYASATMMLRRRAYLEGNSNWSSITETVVKPIARHPAGGMRWDFSYAGISITSGSFSGMTQTQKKNKIISLLNEHPEGIVLYMYGDGKKTHAVLATDYDSASGMLYCADPANGYPNGRIPITKACLTGNTSDEIIGNMRMYWYVKSGTCTITAPIVTPPVHTHSYSNGTDAAHPHSEYKICSSCGEKEYLNSRRVVASCIQCYPLGSVTLKRSFEKAKGTATFYRGITNNASSYLLKLYKDNVYYNQYDMSADTKKIDKLPSGSYYASLTVKNSDTGEEKTVKSQSFKIVDTYKISYNANGGTNAPSYDEKIEGTAKTLSSQIPIRTGYVFKGWARSKNATSAQYQAGGSYDKNASITLYAVWEPETYTITYNSNGGKGELQNVTVTYGDTVSMPNSVVKDGYYLKGWSKTKSASTPDYKLGVDYKIAENCTLYAVWGSATWGGNVSKSLKGSGTEADPYQIATAADLAYLAKKINTQSEPKYEYYILTDNIQLGYGASEKWVPIGINANSKQYFCGTFDGNGYTISDMYITEAQVTSDDEAYVGLFGYCVGKIKNLNVTGSIENITIRGDNVARIYIGGIVGYGYVNGAAVLENCTAKYLSISNINVSNSNLSYPSCYVGALVGEASARVEKCNAIECHISSIGNSTEYMFIFAGLICGEAYGVFDCTVKSTQDSLFSGKIYGSVGAICGKADQIINCAVDAPCLTNNFYNANKNNLYPLGGLAGEVSEKVKACSVTFCSDKYENAIGTSTPFKAYVGGVVGDSYATIEDCSYNGESIKINSDTSAYLGGVVGNARNGSLISRCVVNIDGNLSCNANSTAYVAGIVGNFSSVTNIKNVLMVAEGISSKGSSANGGYIVPSKSASYTIENAYYNSDITIESSTINKEGTPRATRLMTIPSFLTGNLGFGQYVSVANLEKNPNAVWVMKDGELPKLYHTCLNDITVSKDITNGTVTVDRIQAVDGEIVNVTATPEKGYVLNKIYQNGEEITGSTFETSGNTIVYATFSEEIEEFEVSITNDENASGTLTNVDSETGTFMSLSSRSGESSLIANDGEEISVSLSADEDYAVDTLYVNGEEIAGTNFIITKDSVVTMDVANISTDITAITNDAEDVSNYFAVLSGSVSGSGDGVSRYIRYWKSDDIATVYTTERIDGAGEYEVTVYGLEPESTYYYQMTEFGEIKSFKTCIAPDASGADIEDTSIPVTGITLNKSTATLTVGDKVTLTATVSPNNATNKAVSWKSSDGTVASVSNGIVTALSSGTATITATTADGGKKATCIVEVDAEIDEDTPLISASEVTGRAGKTVEVKINISNNPGVIFAKLNVLFGDELTLKEVKDGGLLGNANHSTNKTSPYILYWNNGTAQSDFTGNGTVATLTFEIDEETPDGVYPITVREIESDTFNYDDETIYFSVKNGKITVVSTIIGDVNGDGEITARDERDLSRHIAGWLGYETVDSIAADVNGDGDITARDERDLSRHIAGWLGYEVLPKTN